MADEPNLMKDMASALERVGYDVAMVGSAGRALEVFAQRGADVILSDWRMPDMNGIELVNRLKKRDPLLAAVLITDQAGEEAVIEAFTQGWINYYVTKPLNQGQLLETVAAAVKERKLDLGKQEFRRRLEKEIRQATEELERKNVLLQQKNAESRSLYLELEARQKEIEKTKNYLENLLESSVDAIISVDGEHKINFFGRGAEEMLGYTPDEMLGRPLDKLFKGGRKETGRLMDKLKRKRRLKSFESEMVKRSGQSLFTDISAAKLHHRKGELGLLFVVKDMAERKRLEEELRESNIILERLSITDGLTGLFNHRHFQQCLAEEFRRAVRYRTPMSLIMLDLDDFKRVNDTYGHPVGDQVLMLLADMIRESIREVDTPARYGGEEFAVILPQTEVENSIVVAERLKDTIEHSPRFRAIDSGLTITASIGVCGYPDPGLKAAQDLTRFADKALYLAKQIGKNRIVKGSSTGEVPLGRGELLTPSEKKNILRRVADNLSATLDLNKILDFLLKEIAGALGQTETDPACSIMLMDAKQGLQPAAELNMDDQRRQACEEAARLALESRTVEVFHEGNKLGPTASYPIVLASPRRGLEMVGVVNICAVPTDLDFFKELANQAALGIVNARLYHEVDAARKTLERKVNQLTLIHEVGLALSAADTPDERAVAAQQALKSLTEVLEAAEISVYSFHPEDQALRLVAYSSASAGPGREPAAQVRLEHTRIMRLVVQNAKTSGRAEPLLLNDLKAKLGRGLKKRFSTTSYMGVPLFGGGELLGIMNVTDKLDQTDFTQDDVEVAQITAGMLTPILHTISILDRTEDLTTDAVEAMVRVLESSRPLPEQGRAKRVTQVATAMAEAAGLKDFEVHQVRKSALIHALQKYRQAGESSPETEPVHLTSLALSQWLEGLAPALGAPLEKEDDAALKYIIVAEEFDARFLGLKPKDRPPLAHVLVEILERTGKVFDPDAALSLFQALIGRKIKDGRRILKPEDDVWPVLSAKLARAPGNGRKKSVPADVRKRFLKIIERENP